VFPLRRRLPIDGEPNHRAQQPCVLHRELLHPAHGGGVTGSFEGTIAAMGASQP
jgi:hypothetical protein